MFTGLYRWVLQNFSNSLDVFGKPRLRNRTPTVDPIDTILSAADKFTGYIQLFKVEDGVLRSSPRHSCSVSDSWYRIGALIY